MKAKSFALLKHVPTSLSDTQHFFSALIEQQPTHLHQHHLLAGLRSVAFKRVVNGITLERLILRISTPESKYEHNLINIFFNSMKSSITFIIANLLGAVI